MACARTSGEGRAQVAAAPSARVLTAHILTWQRRQAQNRHRGGGARGPLPADGRLAAADTASPPCMSAIPWTIRPRPFCCAWRAAAGWTACRPCGRWRPGRVPGFAELESGAAAAGLQPRTSCAPISTAARSGLAGRSDERRSALRPGAESARPAPALEEAGLSPARIAAAAAHLARAREALEIGDRGGAGAGVPPCRRMAASCWTRRACRRRPARWGCGPWRPLLMAVSGAGLPAPVRVAGAAFRPDRGGPFGAGRDPAWLPHWPRTPRGQVSAAMNLWSCRKGQGKPGSSAKTALRPSHSAAIAGGPPKFLTFCWLAIALKPPYLLRAVA